MEICQEKVCCVSLKTKQVVAGQHQGSRDGQGGRDHCGQDQDGEDDKEAEKNDEDCDLAPLSCLKCKQSNRNCWKLHIFPVEKSGERFL